MKVLFKFHGEPDTTTNPKGMGVSLSEKYSIILHDNSEIAG
jgi:hypothetical protein